MRIQSIDDLRALLRELPGPDNSAAARAARREASLTKPAGALGRLEELVQHVCAWQGRHPPALERCRLAVFAGNHGVAAEGVSAYPAEVTAQMVANFESGGAAINQLCAQAGLELQVFSLDLDEPTANFVRGPAMTGDECVRAVDVGMLAGGGEIDLLCVGEMGIGNTTSAAALCHAIFGGAAEDWVGPGTGVADKALAIKLGVVRDAVALHPSARRDGLEALRCLGGREIAAIAGAILAARLARVPVVLDGYVCCAAAACLFAAEKTALDHCLAGHVSAEPGHRRLLDALGRKPLLDLGMRLGEGSGAALAFGVLRAAVACHVGMATFDEAGVSERDES